MINDMTCKPSTVKVSKSDTYTAKCTVTFSDGSKWSGYGNLITATDKVTWEPGTQISQ